MNWDEPLAIAERLAASLGGAVVTDPVEAGDGDVLLATAEQLGAPARAAATVIAGSAAEASSAGLTALRERVEAHGLATALATFAAAPGQPGAELPLVVAAPPGSPQVPELLAAGPHSLALDATVETATITAADAPARVCVVSFEASGMTGGGIGTAATSLAESLARGGHDVTLLFTGWQEAGAETSNERWRRHYAERDVRLEVIRAPGGGSVKNLHYPARVSYEVYCWLRDEQPFDVVHLPENMGHGAYAQLAKRQGAAFARTTFAIGTHGPTRWAAEANRVALTREEFLVNEALERVSVALADVLLGPSRYLHRYMREHGWTLPDRVHVQPYATPAAVRPSTTRVPRAVRARSNGGAAVAAPGHPASADAATLPDEIVFFGRIETRKGVVTLCDALDLLAARDDLPRFSVTFLGPVAEVLGQPADAYVAERAERWPWGCEVVSDRDQQGAAEYLARPGVLAAMPSLVDNAPNTVSEAIALGVPFVAAQSGGSGELIDARQRDDHMFAAAGPPLPVPLTAPTVAVDPAPLAELLAHRLTTPVAPARPPATTAAVDAAYDRWHRAVRRTNDVAEEAPGAAAPALPTVTACLLFDGDEELLAEQLAALRDGDGVELVVADLRAADVTGAGPVADGVTVVRPARPGHAADARTAALEASSGELFALVPVGDVPLPSFADGLRRAVAATEADLCACAVLDQLGGADGAVADDEGRDGTGSDGPDGVAAADGDERDAAWHAFVPLPGPPLAGLDGAAFTAGPYAIRRAALERLGGFAADADGDEVDDELLNRAVAAGLRLQVVPEPLAAKRRPGRWAGFRADWPRVTNEPPYDAEQWLRVERPLAADGTLASGDLTGLLRGARGERAQLRAVVEEQREVYEARLAEHRAWIDDLEGKAARWRADQEVLLAEIKALKDESGRLRALNAELSQSAAQLAVRTVRDVGKQVRRRVNR
ncbi:glycosyltransferase [Conexibacter stalactiti]|uniref:Glycosyltransferase n=1 Tax=Conexibacter stalactiti TaxID=1940611 RepID=A0ABU4HM69_9ACTN|nr:glycosyltransferase [Conexibacter stalactiti]MDW5593660.1 glycosyltransferase [Conexibacter stalactiti]MEC5034301.1 glycosyltransferase [Conexibacter stalactiti]